MSGARSFPAADLRTFLRNYGFLGFDLEPASRRCHVLDSSAPIESLPQGAVAVRMLCPEESHPGLDLRQELPGSHFFSEIAERPAWWRKRKPVFRNLEPALSFSANGLRPLWSTGDGRSVLAWRETPGRQELLSGLQIPAEMLRSTHGDPARAEAYVPEEIAGFTHERPIYLYEHQVDPAYPNEPWADALGFTVSEALSQAAGIPLLHPLPDGADGALLLTGDDDEAQLEKYRHQMDLIGDFPITYLLLPTTNHSKGTLAALPDSVELGLHVDSLAEPESYDRACREQVAAVRELCGRPVESVRNHGHLNRGYWGHLPAWEASGLGLDLNIHAWDYTARVGSFLPFRVRRPDGTWSDHWSLFSGFSDAMSFHLGLSRRQQSRLIRRMASQVENGHPGILVMNFHPQNVDDVIHPHRTVLAVGRRPGWVALGAESLLGWLRSRDAIRLQLGAEGASFACPTPAERIAYRTFDGEAWQTRGLRASEGRAPVES